MRWGRRSAAAGRAASSCRTRSGRRPRRSRPADLEVDAAEHLGAGPVPRSGRRRTARDSGPAGAPRARSGSGAARSLEPREAASGRGERALAEVDDPAERLERPDELEQQRDEEHELADRQRRPSITRGRRSTTRRDAERREEDEARQEARLDAGLAHGRVADGLARPLKRSRTSSSRPKACTISMPTTASSDASVRSPLARLHSREMGMTRCAKKYATTRTAASRARGERQPGVDGDQEDRRADDHHHALRAWMRPQPMK